MPLLHPPVRIAGRLARRRQAGASLLEVLVAILILAFGMLAAAGMTVAALQYSKMTQYQAVGVQLASEYGDRMRANRAGFQANNYNRPAVFSGARGTVAEAPACAVVNACTAAEIAAIDRARFTNNLRRQLPAGEAYVVRDATNAWAADIWVMWIDPDLRFGSSDSLMAQGGNQCPAVVSVGSGVPAPRCMYYRISQ